MFNQQSAPPASMPQQQIQNVYKQTYAEEKTESKPQMTLENYGGPFGMPRQLPSEKETEI